MFVSESYKMDFSEPKKNIALKTVIGACKKLFFFCWNSSFLFTENLNSIKMIWKKWFFFVIYNTNF